MYVHARWEGGRRGGEGGVGLVNEFRLLGCEGLGETLEVLEVYSDHSDVVRANVVLQPQLVGLIDHCLACLKR